MKYYETTYDEYLTSIEQYNLHPELKETYNKMPKIVTNFKNTILYGPPGIGKYSQTLQLLKRYSNNELKYDKKITMQTEKTPYTFRISDIHYEIDMALLGCNAKTLWHDIFLQIVDIITVKSEKIGIIVCKNFHKISSDLLEVFYSYMQQYNNNTTAVQLRYILLMDSISFIPSNIINACYRIHMKRPSDEKYNDLLIYNQNMQLARSGSHDFVHRVSEAVNNNGRQFKPNGQKCKQILSAVGSGNILNLKELHAFKLASSTDELPNDLFNLICDNIITEIINIDTVSFPNFRDTLYDILTYNIEVAECVWYILMHLITHNHLLEKDVSDVLTKTHSFLKYYNNNYRPIYHLENILLYITSKIHKYDDL